MEHISIQQLVLCRQDKEENHEVYKYRARRGAGTYK